MTDKLAENFLLLWKVLRQVSHPVRLGEITQEQYWLLRNLKNEPKSVGDLAQALGITQSSVTTACKRMEQKGLLERKRGVDDERVVMVSVTPLGARQVELWHQQRKEALGVLLKPLNTEEQELLNQLVERILEAQRFTINV